MCWAYSINTWVAAGLGGVNKTKLPPKEASIVFSRVSKYQQFLSLKLRTALK